MIIMGDWSLKDEMRVILRDSLISAHEREARLAELAERYLDDIDDDDFEGMADCLEEWLVAVFEILGEPSPSLH